MAAGISIALLLVGLPLLAWWVGGRRFWGRVESRHGDAVRQEREWIARHRLTAAEQAQVDRALLRGAALEDPRLRAAVVERARGAQAAARTWQADHPRWTAAMRWLGAIWLLLLATAVVFAVTLGEVPSALPVYAVGAVVSAGAGWWQRRNLRRAIELNGGDAPPG